MISPSDCKGVIYFSFANPAGFSGQKAATEIVVQGLEKRGWICRCLPQPVLDRERGGMGARWRHGWNMILGWIRALRLLFSPGAWLCVNLGQTQAAFVRDAVPLLLGRVGLGRAHVVISLHGNLFMQWARESKEVRVFRKLLRLAGTVTVLGERQRARLITLGVPADEVVVVVNSCDVPLATAGAVAAKQKVLTAPGQTVRCLFLSSLIDTKGFPEYLDALLQIASLPGARIEAVLCGRLVASDFSSRFRNHAAAEQWIEQQIVQINQSERVQVRWIKGAFGTGKVSLFREAHVFVLPTRYAVEAQPLVLLEAMASGCAIVTSRAGEIATILDENSAILLSDPSAAALAGALQSLIDDGILRRRLALAGHARFSERYQISRHLDAWEILLNGDRFQPDGTPHGIPVIDVD